MAFGIVWECAKWTVNIYNTSRVKHLSLHTHCWVPEWVSRCRTSAKSYILCYHSCLGSTITSSLSIAATKRDNDEEAVNKQFNQFTDFICDLALEQDSVLSQYFLFIPVAYNNLTKCCSVCNLYTICQAFNAYPLCLKCKSKADSFEIFSSFIQLNNIRDPRPSKNVSL